MGWIVRLVETGPATRRRRIDVMEIDRSGDLAEIDNLGLSLAEGKRLLERVQREVVAAQAREHAGCRPRCGACGARRRVKDYQTRRIDTVFGRVVLRLPRFQCAGCAETVAGVSWPLHSRSTPELDRLRAYLSALTSYRSAAAVLKALLPVDGGGRPETLRNRTLRAGEELRRSPLPMPPSVPSELSVSVDSTYIRSCEPGERLRWRLWHGKATNARGAIGRIRTVMRAYRDARAQRGKGLAPRQFWAALLGFDGYLRGQSAGERHDSNLWHRHGGTSRQPCARPQARQHPVQRLPPGGDPGARARRFGRRLRRFDDGHAARARKKAAACHPRRDSPARRLIEPGGLHPAGSWPRRFRTTGAAAPSCCSGWRRSTSSPC
jgi:hypothetical protein